jgi:hypothetical protein
MALFSFIPHPFRNSLVALLQEVIGATTHCNRFYNNVMNGAERTEALITLSPAKHLNGVSPISGVQVDDGADLPQT